VHPHSEGKICGSRYASDTYLINFSIITSTGSLNAPGLGDGLATEDVPADPAASPPFFSIALDSGIIRYFLEGPVVYSIDEVLWWTGVENF